MGRVKQWAMDNAEKFLSNLENQVLRGHQTIESAMLLVKSADIAWDLIGFNHIDEVEEYLEDVIHKTHIKSREGLI
tara:strand:+ start:417 stop:644 length:228 start_codon:yes stop_codon:yes gene_type:complete